MTPRHPTKDFEQLEVSQIYCPKCKSAMPVRKRLLLVLLDKETYDYVCARCGFPVGRKEEPLQPAPLAIPKMRGKRMRGKRQ
jgi:DNA-directed RNA polymerase subunit RPC12/RpoP